MITPDRRLFIKKREELKHDFIKDAENLLLHNFIGFYSQKLKTVMSYVPIRNEAPVNGINEYIIRSKTRLCLPVTMEDDTLKAAFADDMSILAEGKYKIPEPKDKSFADAKDIDAVMVPGVIFDRTGGRKGYGKGCYDRFLSNGDFIKVGVCYEFQITDSPLALEDHDMVMDYLLTERCLYEVKK